VRVRHLISRCGWVVVASALLVVPSSGTALAQLEITPETSITPSSHVTSWVFQMAVASVILAVLVLVGFTLAYLRFAPGFSGREGKKPAAPPGSRPAELTRQAASMRWVPPTAPTGTQASAAPAGQGTATAVAERPAPTPAPEPRPAEPAVAAAEAPAPAAPEPEAAPQAPASEPQPAPAAAPEAPAAQAPAPAQPPPAQPAHGAGLDQETFDRVLEEQLAKGVDRRVAEGRARAAAVVAARKKSQG
jgi:hypothetical protein